MMWFRLLPKWAAVNFLAYFGAPILALFYECRDGWCDNHNAYRVEPRLPERLGWFQTPDNSLLGDGAWQRMEPDHWEWRAKFSRWPRLQSCLGRLGWLWRNPAYDFERVVLGANVSAFSPDDIKVRGNVWIKDGDKGVPGFCFVRVGPYWNLVWIKRLYGSRCLYWNFGWNLKTYAEQPSRINEDPISQYVFSPRFSEVFP